MSMRQFINLAEGIKPNFDKYPQDRNIKTKITFNEMYEGEDQPEHVHTKVDMNTKKTTVENVKGHGRNPSGRRDGVILSGHCETGCKFEIEIAQHKGNTFFKSNKTGVIKHD